MTVIIPHQDDELKLRNIQNKLLSELNKSSKDDSDCSFFYGLEPLWIIISDENKQLYNDISLKELSKSITKVQLCELYEDSENYKIGLRVLVGTAGGGDLSGYLPLISSYKNKTTNKKISLEELPLSLKIFRLGKAIKPTNNSMAISDFVWTKLKA